MTEADRGNADGNPGKPVPVDRGERRAGHGADSTAPVLETRPDGRRP
jgi:hypothetical protein